MQILYLTSEYPAISHTFILQEIKTLRAQKEPIRIATASIRRPQNVESMGSEEQAEYHATLYLREKLLRRGLLALWSLCKRKPKGAAALLYHGMRFCLCDGPKSLVKTGAYILEAAILLEHCHAKDIAHVHVHFANPAATVAMLAASSYEIDFSISAHGPDIFYDCRENLLAMKAKRARFVRCISHYCASQFMRLMPPQDWGKLHVVRCGVCVEDFTPLSTLAEHHDEANHDEGGKEKLQYDESVPQGIRFLCLGRLCPAKAQALLIEAFTMVYAYWENTYEKQTDAEKRAPFYVPPNIHIVGGGQGPSDPYGLEALQVLVGNNSVLRGKDAVHFTGPLSHDQSRAHYAKADIFVLPSVAEGVPIVLMEAMAMEIPCISTHITGIGELIDTEKDGILCTAGDVQSLTDAMIRLMEDASLRRTLGKAGREKVLARYDLRINAEHMAQLFREQLAFTISES